MVQFFQFFDKESSTYTYLIADGPSREAALIDPVIENIERDLLWLKELDLQLKYVFDTHVHADHVTAAGKLRQRTSAKTAISKKAQVDCADIPLDDGSELFLGSQKITAFSTPGHTDSCMSFYFAGRIFTGDALLIHGAGRTDFQQGSASVLYDSITRKLFTLPDDTLVFPAHDYQGQSCSTVAVEKKFNPRIGGGKSKAEFVKIMSELKLSLPKQIHRALPANMDCGQTQGGS